MKGVCTDHPYYNGDLYPKILGYRKISATSLLSLQLTIGVLDNVNSYNSFFD